MNYCNLAFSVVDVAAFVVVAVACDLMTLKVSCPSHREGWRAVHPRHSSVFERWVTRQVF